MDRALQFPPLLTPERRTEPDAHLAAIAAAQAGAEAGTLIWVDRNDAIDCAFVMRPDDSIAHPELVAYVAMVAIGDALGGLLPEQAPVAFEWPDRILVNDGCIGGIRLASASGGTAAWVVLGVMLAVEADPLDEPGHHPEVTTLGDEFAYSEQFSPADLLEAIARNFLHWVERWQDEGFGPVRRAWLARAVGHHEQVLGRRSFFRVEHIDEDGAVTLRREGVQRVLTLAQGLRRRSWWLPDRFGAYRSEVEQAARVTGAGDG
jgi:biotin-(acetyl-CoA carboxylase) ligase